MSLFGKWFGFGRNEVYDEGVRAYDLGAYEDAVEAFETCLNDAPEPAMVRLATFQIGQCYSQLGATALGSGDAAGAAKHFSKAITLFPSYPDLHLNLAKAYRALSQPEAETLCIDRALEINPNYVDAVLARGVSAYEASDFETGLEWIGRAADLEPSLKTERFSVAMELHQTGDHRRAAANFALVASPSASDANFHARVAASLAKEGRALDSLAEYEKAIHLAPKYADVRCGYGQALMEVNLYDEAIVQFRAAVEVNESYADAHAQLGIALRCLNRDAEAAKEFKTAYKLDPTNPIARFEVDRPQRR